jgi:hypothetical protein
MRLSNVDYALYATKGWRLYWRFSMVGTWVELKPSISFAVIQNLEQKQDCYMFKVEP